MAWEAEMLRYLRHMVDDLDEDDQRYDDTQLQETLLWAAQQVVAEVDFNQAYTIAFDDFEISPDPTESATRDEQFIKLVSLKAACKIDRAELRRASRSSVEVVDNRSRVKLTGPLEGAKEIHKNGWCKEYEQAKMDYAHSKHLVGRAIMTPFPYDGGTRWGQIRGNCR